MKLRMITLLGFFAFALSVCAQSDEHGADKKMDMAAKSPVTKAVAVLATAPGHAVSGDVTFEQVDGGIKIIAEIHGLTPGKHGFHIHEYGDCSNPDFTSAGSHFMMSGEAHGAPADSNRHKGDMGNIEADENGVAMYEWVNSEISFSGPNSILGRAVIVHEKEDDLTSQPTGAAGGRVACGIIGVVKTE